MTDVEPNTDVTAAPEATTTPNTEQETFDREYVEKLRRENAAYRTKAKEAQEAAEAAKLAAEREKLDEVERLKAEKADLERAAAEAKATATAAERKAALTGKVADPAAALKLLDESQHLNEDGTVNTDALLQSFPFLAPVPTGPGGVSIGGTPNPAGKNLTPEAIKNMTPDEINRNWDSVQAALKRS